MMAYRFTSITPPPYDVKYSHFVIGKLISKTKQSNGGCTLTFEVPDRNEKSGWAKGYYKDVIITSVEEFELLKEVSL